MSKLLFGLHMHQPVDNLQEAVDNAVKLCYEPLIETLKKYPSFKTTLHCSGWLFDTLRQRYTAIFENIKYLCEKGSMELVSGGYYEPILASIPDQDRIEQILKMNEFIQTHFNQTPKGLWLTERVWESSIIPQLKRCSIEYLAVDDYHFLASGFDKSDLDGYFYTEESGEKIALFPISKDLRYAIPFWPVEKAVELLQKQRYSIIFDDAEKFGLWPKTYTWVYENGWLEKFIQEVQNRNIETIHYSEALQDRANGIAYLANVSYYEMGEWSLKAKDILELEKLKSKFTQEYFERIGIKFIRGGIWKNFFIKYEESNRLHKRMLGLSSKIKAEPLWKLQTNDVYWHGIFGGLYLPNLRDNAYRFVSECENILENREEILDEDMDGFLELTCKTEESVWRMYEKNGGQIIEILDLKSGFNFQNSLTRRFEAYHKQIHHPKTNRDGIDTIHTLPHQLDEKLKSEIHYDWTTKNSAIDHITDIEFDIEKFLAYTFKEYGDFANQPSNLRADRVFERDGGIYDTTLYPTTITKKYQIERNTLFFTFSLRTQSKNLYRYVNEWNIHFARYENLIINGKHYDDMLTIHAKILRIEDPFTGKELQWQFDRELEIYIVPIKTLSQNEQGFELTQQAISIAFHFPFECGFELGGSLCLK